MKISLEVSLNEIPIMPRRAEEAEPERINITNYFLPFATSIYLRNSNGFSPPPDILIFSIKLEGVNDSVVGFML